MIHINYFEGRRIYDLSLQEITGTRARVSATRIRYAQPKKIFVKVERNNLDQATFDLLVAKWVEAVSFSSSLDEIVSDENYLRIISYGKDALPYIFADLRSSPKAWFVALRRITGANPIPSESAGNFQKMLACWLSWAAANNL